MMMGRGHIRVRAIIHGILMNTLNSLLSIPKVNENGAFTCKYLFHLFNFYFVLEFIESVMKIITLKLVEFSQPRFYLQFG